VVSVSIYALWYETEENRWQICSLGSKIHNRTELTLTLTLTTLSSVNKGL